MRGYDVHFLLWIIEHRKMRCISNHTVVVLLFVKYREHNSQFCFAFQGQHTKSVSCDNSKLLNCLWCNVIIPNQGYSLRFEDFIFFSFLLSWSGYHLGSKNSFVIANIRRKTLHRPWRLNVMHSWHLYTEERIMMHLNSYDLHYYSTRRLQNTEFLVMLAAC